MLNPTPHAFVRSDNRRYGEAFGGACDAMVLSGATMRRCGWPESASFHNAANQGYGRHATQCDTNEGGSGE